MTKVNGFSPLSTRDINREDNNDILNREEEAICVEKIKARFDRIFLPKYGDMWRQMIREKESTVIVSDGDSLCDTTTPSLVAASLPDPRAINFLEAIERKQAVSISASRPHGEECECGCAPPIEEFIELDEEQAKNITFDRKTPRKTSRSYTSRSSPSERNNTSETVHSDTEHSKTMSDEETETEIDEGDSPSVYETANEFEDEDSNLENTKSTALNEEKAYSVTTRNNEYEENEQKKARNDEIVIIDIDSDIDEMEDNLRNVVATQTHKSDEDNVIDEIDGDDEKGSSGLNLSELHISTKEKEIKGGATNAFIGAQRNPCLSPQSVAGTPSSIGNNPTSKATIDDPLVDTDDEADDEHDTESDDDEEAEWIPDDESLLPSPKSTPEPKKHIEKRKVEKQRISETIDLCDSSSFDEAADSDFTVSDDDEDSLDDKKQIASVVTSRKQGKGTSKASFRRNRDQITSSAFDEFNRNAFRGELGKVVVQWSKKLNTTAGLTRLQKLSTNMTPGVPMKRQAVIELSTKVVDDEEKLRTTLLHELVHAAVWILEGVSRPPHGADFKRWAKIAMSKVPDVIVTTTHNYQIQYKFNWACMNPKCSFQIGRHSKSVDTIRHRCGLCKGKLIEVTSDGAPKKRAPPSAYNLFVKQHSKVVRGQLVKQKPGVTQADVMKELGRRWREQKGQSTS
jgi:predicted SprT family Zn-dependent metalloprotease